MDHLGHLLNLIPFGNLYIKLPFMLPGVKGCFELRNAIPLNHLQVGAFNQNFKR
jgi:hypothetical protein